MKRLIAFVITSFAAVAAFNACAGASHGGWDKTLAYVSKDLPAFLHYHPTDGNPMRP
jgi:hypothetical protein